jgi:hypothetical protein
MMQMKKFGITGMIGIILLFSVSCTSKLSSFYPTETECLGVELDGSQTLKAWGVGRYWKDAAEQAKKNAVHDVLFKGRFTGSKDCHAQPLLFEVNAREKHEAYFNAFFRDGGEYAGYVSLKDERIPRRALRKPVSRNKDQSKFSVVVRVKRSELKEKLISDGIIKQ